MKKSAALVLTLTAISTVSFGLTLHSMDKAQVDKAFVNNTATSIPTANLNGRRIQNSVTVFLNKKGQIFGKMEPKPMNAPQTDHGTYVIKHDGTMMVTWKHWDHAKPIHAHFFDTKNAYVAIDNAMVFHTAFMKAEIHSGNHLK